MAFQVGELICGLPNRYTHTNEHMRLAVVESVWRSGAYGNYVMKVKVIEHDRFDCIGQCYTVHNSTTLFKRIVCRDINSPTKEEIESLLLA